MLVLTTEVFKILYLLSTFVGDNDFTSYCILYYKCHHLKFFWIYFHSKIFVMLLIVNIPLCKISSESGLMR